MKLSVIIPVYNEESTIGEVIERVLDVSFEKEIIVVDDGSRDSTSNIVERIQGENVDVVKVYTSPVNFGKGAAIRIGLQFVTGDIVIIQDADLELDPQEYENLLKPIERGEADVVYGSRFLRPTPGISRKTRIVNWGLAKLANLLYGTHLTDEGTAYKVFKASVIRNVPLQCIRFEFCPEVTAKISRMGYCIYEVPVEYRPRSKSTGKKLRYLRDGTHAVLTLLRFRMWQPPNVRNGRER